MSIISYFHLSSLTRRTVCLLLATSVISCSTTNKNPSDKAKDALKEKYPLLTKPEIRTMWVDDTIDGNKFIEGHRVYILEKGSGWTK